jgi:hypothetical protein
LQGGKEQQEGEKGAASLHAGVEPEDAADEGGEGDGDDLSDMLEAELASGEEQDAPDDEAAAIEASGPNQATRDDAVHLAPASYATRCGSPCSCAGAAVQAGWLRDTASEAQGHCLLRPRCGNYY